MSDDIRGRLVTLRPLTPEDEGRLREIAAEPSVAQWWGVDPELPPATSFAIVVDGEVAGGIQYWEEDDVDYRHASIDVFLGAAHQGRGLGTDAVRTLARYLLEERGHHRLTIDPAAANERAIRSYERVGFKPVGVMRQYERGPDGTYHDNLLMDLVAGELRD